MTRYIPVADCARLVRAALKDAFPGVTFSVRSKSYAGGASIRIAYWDGPTTRQVDAVVDRFRGATFDGMIDLQSPLVGELDGERVHFGSDYIFAQRSLSMAFLAPIVAKVCAYYGVPMIPLAESADGSAYVSCRMREPGGGRWFSDVIYQWTGNTPAADYPNAPPVAA